MPDRNQTPLPESIRDHCRGTIRENERLAPHTTLRIGGEVECWFEPEDETSLSKALQITHARHDKVYIIGGGSNLLLPDKMTGLAIYLGSRAFKGIRLQSDQVVAGAGEPLSRMVQFLWEHQFGECEFLIGIPALVGGAVAMNAGSRNQWIGTYVKEVFAMNMNGQKRRIPREEIRFGYRDGGLGGHAITRVHFLFPHVKQDETLKRMNDYSDYRRKTQDLQFPSAGCMFRNPEGSDKSAGELIEEAGLKGLQVGDAQVSTKHANFVVNRGAAVQRDVLRLLEKVDEEIFKKFHIRLQREIKVILSDSEGYSPDPSAKGASG